MYLLDTNVVSELRKVRLGKADRNVARWADSIDAADLYVSVIAIQELEIGVPCRRNAATLRKGRCFGPGSTEGCCRLSKVASWRSIPRLRNAARGSMCPTRARCAMAWSRPPPSVSMA